MKQCLFLMIMIGLAATQTGCVHVQYLDAISSGLYDFIAGSVTEVLSANLLSPFFPA